MSTTLVRRITQVAVVALVAGFSVTAWADGPKGQAATGGGALRFDAKTCTAAERAAVTEAYAVARERAAEGLRVAMANPNDARVVRWFGQGQERRVVQVLQAVVRQLDTPDYTIACASSAYCVQRQPMAYTSHANRIVGYCAGFFRASLTGEDSRMGTVIHELTHLAAQTQDHAYGRNNARALSTAKATNRAAENADSYEYFIETLRE